jgi:hypothetical protein
MGIAMISAVAGAVAVAIATRFLGDLPLELFREWRGGRTAARAKQRLREALLAPQFEWRKFETLCRIAGSTDEQQVRTWLIEIGARQSGDDQAIWTLKKRDETILSEGERKAILETALSQSGRSGCRIEILASEARLTPRATERLLTDLGAVRDSSESDLWRLPDEAHE